MELHHAHLWQLPPAAAWTATADLARLALAVPHLDRDLADRLPERDGALAAELRNARVYVALRVAASETIRLAGGQERDDSAAALAPPPPARALVVQYPHQLPEGLQRLTAMFDNARAVSMRDYRLAAGAVARSALTAAATLERVPGPNVRPAIEVLHELSENAGEVAAANWRSIASLAPPSPALDTSAVRSRSPATPSPAAQQRRGLLDSPWTSRTASSRSQRRWPRPFTGAPPPVTTSYPPMTTSAGGTATPTCCGSGRRS